MADLLIELFSEEIPARMQSAARDALRKMVTDGLVAAGLTYQGAAAFSTPRTGPSRGSADWTPFSMNRIGTSCRTARR